jgi:hypothetical protein
VEDPAVPVHEGDVQSEAHEEHVDGAALLNAEPLPHRQLAAPHQAAESGEKGIGNRAVLGDDGAVSGLQAEGSGHHDRMVAAEGAPRMV